MTHQALAAVSIIAVWLAAARAADTPAQPAEDKPPVLITVGKDTTYITEPLRPDGYVDYLAALNQRASQGVTPENNAAVLLRKAFGPPQSRSIDRNEYFRQLGIEELPEKGEYFQTLFNYAYAIEKRTGKEGVADQADKQHLAALDGPWSPTKFKLLARWLAANEAPMELIRKAAIRGRYHEPMLGKSMLACGVDDIGAFREAQRAFCVRAMLRTSQRQYDDAWGDLLTGHRLARAIGQKPFFVSRLVGSAIDGLSCQADQRFLNHADFTSAQVMKMRDDLAALPPAPPIADCINTGERFTILDFATSLARDGVDQLYVAALFSDVAQTFLRLDDDIQVPTWLDTLRVRAMKSLYVWLGRVAVDWDAVLRDCNGWCDRVVAALREPTPDQRRTALKAIDSDLEKIKTQVGDWRAIAFDVLRSPRAPATRWLSRELATMFVGSLTQCVRTEDRFHMQSTLNLLAFSLAAYRADHGKYPERLEQLVPKYAAEIPKDIFTDGDLHYRVKDGECAVYSVGVNGRDDGGKGYEERKEDEDWFDDIVVRLRRK